MTVMTTAYALKDCVATLVQTKAIHLAPVTQNVSLVTMLLLVSVLQHYRSVIL